MVFPIYNISDFLNEPCRRIEYFVGRFETMDAPENVAFPHKHSFYEMLWVRKGASRCAVDYREYRVEPNTLFFISPGQVHLFQEWDGVEADCLLLEPDFFLLNLQDKNALFEMSFLNNFYAEPLVKLSPPESLNLERTVELLYAEKSCPETVRALFFVFLRQIQRVALKQSRRQYSTHQLNIFKKLQELLETHFAQNLSVAEYAARLNVSEHYLNRTVKTVAGLTAGNLIRSRTVLEAKRLLHFSSLNVNEIAECLGFVDPSYFARFFKKSTTLAPLDFRRQMSEKYRKR